MEGVEAEIARNSVLWERWLAHGVRPGSVLAVDFHFYASRIAAGKQLADDLRSAGFTVKTSITRTLLVFRGLSIEATESAAWTLERLNARTEELFRAARARGVLFDGLGAEMPG